MHVAIYACMDDLKVSKEDDVMACLGKQFLSSNGGLIVSGKKKCL